MEIDDENENYEEDYQDEIEGEEIQFRDEVGAYLRAGGGINIGLEKADQKIITPIEKFKINVDGIARKIKEYGYINEKDIETLLEVADKLEYINYKNPTLYVIGYITSEGGKKIKKEVFNDVNKKIVPLFNDQSIQPPDVIRYGRLWTEQLT